MSASPPASSPAASLSARMDRLENDLSRKLDTIMADLAEIKKAPPAAAATAKERTVQDRQGLESKKAAQEAQERLEDKIQSVYDQFAKFDEDGSGALSADEVGVALSSLVEMPGRREVNSSDVEEIMKQYDTDGNGVLDAEEFKIFVRDLVLNGKFHFKEDLQQAVDQIAMAAKEDPWADVLRGDSGVRSMIEGLRKDRQMMSSRASYRGEGADELGDSDSFARFSSRASQRGRRIARDSLGALSSRRSRSPTAPPGRCSRFGETCWSLVCCCCKWLPVLHPDGRLRSLWNVAMALFILYCGVVVPLEIAFEVSMEKGMGPQGFRVWEWWNICVDILFIVDILLNFRTGFLVEGQLVKEGPRIARHYLRGAFLIDLIGSFPLNLVLMAVNNDDSGDGAGRLNRQLRLLRIIKLNRLLRLAKLSKNLKYIELFIKFNPSMMRVVKMFLLMFGTRNGTRTVIGLFAAALVCVWAEGRAFESLSLSLLCG